MGTAVNGIDYFISSPDGKRIRVDKRVFDAVQRFVDGKLQGSVTIQFLSGGVRGVTDSTVYVVNNS
jgi:hypothetical protein